jgi:CDP-paratose 2-epimerase
MSVALITGSAGLVGSEAARYFAELGFDVVGIDNDMRAYYFGTSASTEWNRVRLERELTNYIHASVDIRDETAVTRLMAHYGRAIEFIVHTAAQPSHDWAVREPLVDFDVNARATLVLLESARQYCPSAPFIYLSTNKVYGDRPNALPLEELDTRWEIALDHAYADGVAESMPVDMTLHSLFGVSKLAADVMVQEYGRYFSMPTVCFRCGCLTGPNHSGAQLHGFLAYLMHCTVARKRYTIHGYKGKQVRDNLHSHDLIRAFDEFRKAPRCGEVYNLGGSRLSNCSVLEAIRLCEEISEQELDMHYSDTHRTGDHIWWISDVSKFQSHYPQWTISWDLRRTLEEICEAQRLRAYDLQAV